MIFLLTFYLRIDRISTVNQTTLSTDFMENTMKIRINKKDFERIKEYMAIVEKREQTTGIILESKRDFERVKPNE